MSPHGIAVDSRGDIYVGEVSVASWPSLFPGQPRPDNLRSLQKLVKVRIAPQSPRRACPRYTCPEGAADGSCAERQRRRTISSIVMSARGAATAVAFHDPWRSLTYGELDDGDRALRRRAARRRHRRASGASRCCCSTRWIFPIAFWGAIRAGVVPVPINTLLTHEMVGYILADSRAEALVDLGAAGARRCCRCCTASRSCAAIIVAQPDGDAPPDRRCARGRLADFLAGGDPATRDGGDAGGRGGVLALFVRLDRRAEGRAACPRQPARDRRHLRRAGAAASAPTT